MESAAAQSTMYQNWRKATTYSSEAAYVLIAVTVALTIVPACESKITNDGQVGYPVTEVLGSDSVQACTCPTLFLKILTRCHSAVTPHEPCLALERTITP